MRLRRSMALAFGLVLLTFLAVAGLTSAQTTTLQLAALNNSGITGTATLEDVAGGQTRVRITLQGAPAGVAMPAHVHEGTCANLNPTPRFPLTNVQGGTSETTINTTVANLTSGQFAINIHKSPQEAAVYVACGNITMTAGGGAPAAAPRTGAGGMAESSTLPWLAAFAAMLALAAGGVYALRRRA